MWNVNYVCYSIILYCQCHKWHVVSGIRCYLWCFTNVTSDTQYDITFSNFLQTASFKTVIFPCWQYYRYGIFLVHVLTIVMYISLINSSKMSADNLSLCPCVDTTNKDTFQVDRMCKCHLKDDGFSGVPETQTLSSKGQWLWHSMFHQCHNWFMLCFITNSDYAECWC